MKQRTKVNLLFMVLVAGAGVLPAACGSKKPPVSPDNESASTTPTDTSSAATSDTSATDSASASASASAPAPTPLGNVLFTDADRIQKLYDAAAAAPTATLDPKPKPTDPVAKGIATTA